MIKPLGFHVLIKMEKVEQEVKEGALAGFQLTSDTQNKREQTGHDIGVVVSFGPLAYVGWEGVEGVTPEERAQSWGVEVGDKVEFNRYDGKELEHPDYQGYRIMADKDLIGALA